MKQINTAKHKWVSRCMCCISWDWIQHHLVYPSRDKALLKRHLYKLKSLRLVLQDNLLGVASYSLYINRCDSHPIISARMQIRVFPIFFHKSWFIPPKNQANAFSCKHNYWFLNCHYLEFVVLRKNTQNRMLDSLHQHCRNLKWLDGWQPGCAERVFIMRKMMCHVCTFTQCPMCPQPSLITQPENEKWSYVCQTDNWRQGNPLMQRIKKHFSKGNVTLRIIPTAHSFSNTFKKKVWTHIHSAHFTHTYQHTLPVFVMKQTFTSGKGTEVWAGSLNTKQWKQCDTMIHCWVWEVAEGRYYNTTWGPQKCPSVAHITLFIWSQKVGIWDMRVGQMWNRMLGFFFEDIIKHYTRAAVMSQKHIVECAYFSSFSFKIRKRMQLESFTLKAFFNPSLFKRFPLQQSLSIWLGYSQVEHALFLPPSLSPILPLCLPPPSVPKEQL